MQRGIRRIAVTALAAGVWLPTGLVSAQRPETLCLLRLEADPPRTFLNIGSEDSVLTTPADTLIPPGYYRVETSLSGYEPLVQELRLEAGDTVTVHFILLSEPPLPPTPEDLDLSYRPIVPLVPEDKALSVRNKYNTMAEIFAIIPLAQGIMAAAALGGGGEYLTSELVIAGACLSVGSFVMGRIMSSRKMTQIRRTNSGLVVENAEAERHNKEVDVQIREFHAEAMREWQAEAAWRGRVEISGTRF